MTKTHHYKTQLIWKGNLGKGTISYKSYSRNYEISIKGKPVIVGSSDPSFMGDQDKYNPEELFLASISSCHMLWFLHLCSVVRIVVVDYSDEAIGTMIETTNGSGAFSQVTLYPKIVVTKPFMTENIDAIHSEANKMCFIANSCNFPINHQASCEAIEELI